jgi:hypothetical protein
MLLSFTAAVLRSFLSKLEQQQQKRAEQTGTSVQLTFLQALTFFYLSSFRM